MIRIVRGPTWVVAGGCILALSGCDLSGSEPSRAPIELGFYIGVTPANRPAFVDIGRQRETLREQGVEPSSDLVRWLPVSDIKNWIEDPSERGAVETDAASYFQLNGGLVGARRGEEYYILVHTAPDRRMAYSKEGP